MSKRSFRTALLLVSATLVGLLVVGLVVRSRVMQYPNGSMGGSGEVIEVNIERGMVFPSIANHLKERGLIDNARYFRLYGMARGVTTKVRSGLYTLNDSMTHKELLDALIEGVKELNASITIKEGLHMLEIFDAFEEKGIAKRSELEALARDADFLKARGIDAKTIDGYLFPETYQFKTPTPPQKVLDTLLDQHRKIWAKIVTTYASAYAKQKALLGWSDYQFLTMASIVEKEAVVDEERPRIAQVFINRLISDKFVPHRLDTDPTIRYGCMVATPNSKGCKGWDPSQRLRRAQLDDAENTYNTYQHEGLPPGPICNPGEKSMIATINPDGSGYFFFVARNDGTHVFSKTRGQHEKAVDEFQR